MDRSEEAEALVVFTGEGTHPLSPLLKPGFRHVFCAVRDRDHWCVVDGAEGLPVLYVGHGDDLAVWYREQGYTVLEVPRRERTRAPFVVASCVGMVKAIVGIRSLAQTPWGLYRHLRRSRTCD